MICYDRLWNEKQYQTLYQTNEGYKYMALKYAHKEKQTIIKQKKNILLLIILKVVFKKNLFFYMFKMSSNS